MYSCTRSGRWKDKIWQGLSSTTLRYWDMAMEKSPSIDIYRWLFPFFSLHFLGISQKVTFDFLIVSPMFWWRWWFMVAFLEQGWSPLTREDGHSRGSPRTKEVLAVTGRQLHTWRGITCQEPTGLTWLQTTLQPSWTTVSDGEIGEINQVLRCHDSSALILLFESMSSFWCLVCSNFLLCFLGQLEEQTAPVPDIPPLVASYPHISHIDWL